MIGEAHLWGHLSLEMTNRERLVGMESITPWVKDIPPGK